MKLQTKIISHFNPRKVKFLTINAMGLAGIAIAIAAILFSQDQAAVLSQLNQELSQSTLGIIFSSIKTLF